MSAHRTLALTSALLISASSMAAADGFLPDECTAYLTTQSRSCSVTNYYTCPSSPGDRWTISYGANGPYFMTRIDQEAQWVEAHDLPEGNGSRVLMQAIDPSSITTLLATGYDDYTFEEQLEGAGIIRYEGYDRLTGESVIIDGEHLLATSFQYREINPQDGTVLATITGAEFVSERHRRFFAGVRTHTDAEGDITTDNTPVEFIYPQEAGFLSSVPAYGCDTLIGGLSAPGDHA